MVGIPGEQYMGPSGSAIHFPKKVALVTGGFDPLHSGHIALLQGAAETAEIVVVGINSDQWLERKKGKYLLSADERVCIMNSLKMVDRVIEFNDDDDTANEAIKLTKHLYPEYEIVFCNGGDRGEENTPEMSFDFANVVHLHTGVDFRFGVGGDEKQNSSSWITDKFASDKEQRTWGWYRVLVFRDNVKVKELKVNPGCGMSLQRHFKREEMWWVFDGQCKVRYNFLDELLTQGRYTETIDKTLKRLDQFSVPVGGIHQIYNPYKQPCRIIEFQYGEASDEDDIERIEYYD